MHVHMLPVVYRNLNGLFAQFFLVHIIRSDFLKFGQIYNHGHYFFFSLSAFTDMRSCLLLNLLPLSVSFCQVWS